MLNHSCNRNKFFVGWPWSVALPRRTWSWHGPCSKLLYIFFSFFCWYIFHFSNFAKLIGLCYKSTINYSITENQVLWQNLKLRPCHIHWVIGTSIWRGQGLRFSHKDQTYLRSISFLRYIYSRFVQVLENLESPGKRLMVLESSGNLLNLVKNMKYMEDSKEN